MILEPPSRIRLTFTVYHVIASRGHSSIIVGVMNFAKDRILGSHHGEWSMTCLRYMQIFRGGGVRAILYLANRTTHYLPLVGSPEWPTGNCEASKVLLLLLLCQVCADSQTKDTRSRTLVMRWSEANSLLNA